MTICTEDLRKDAEEEKNIVSDDIEIKWKRKNAYVRFFFSEGTTGNWIKVPKEKLKKIMSWQEGSVHSTILPALVNLK